MVLLGSSLRAVEGSAADDLVRKGRAHAAKREHAQAFAAFTEAIKLAPTSGQAWVERADCYVQLGEIDLALADYTRAIEHDPDSAARRAARAGALAAKGEFDRALADCWEAVRLDPRAAEPLSVRGEVYLARGELEKAAADFRDALRLDPRAVRAHIGLGQIQLKKKDYEWSIASFAWALQLNPWSISGHVYRSLIHEARGQADKAAADYKAALALDERKAYRDRGNGYLMLGNLDRALADFNEVLRLDPKCVQTYLARAEVFDRKKDVTAALRDCDEAIRLAPGSSRGYTVRAAHFLTNRQADKALADLRRALLIDRQYLLAQSLVARAHSIRGEIDKGLTLCDQVLRVDPLNSVALQTRARIFLLISERNKNHLTLDGEFRRFGQGERGSMRREEWHDHEQNMPAHIYRTAFSPDGRLFLRSGDTGPRGAIRVWEAETGRLVGGLLTGRDVWFADAFFLGDGARIVSWYSKDSQLFLWDVSTCRLLRTFAGHTSPPFRTTASADGKRILSSSRDRSVRLWDAETGLELRKLDGIDGVLSPDGKSMLVLGTDKRARLWTTGTGKEVRTLRGFASESQVLFSPDSRYILAFGGDGPVRLWEAGSGEAIHTWKGHTGEVLGVQFLDGGRLVVSWGRDATLRYWDVTSDQEVRRLHLGNDLDPSFAIAVRPDGRLLLALQKDQTLLARALPEGKEVGRFPGARRAKGFSFSPDGRFAAAGSFRSGVYFFTLPDGPTGAVGHADTISAVALSPDGRFALTCSCGPWVKNRYEAGSNFDLCLWDVDTGKQVRRLAGHTANVFSVAFAPDGKTVLSGSADKTARVWEVATGRELRRFKGHEGDVYCVVYSADGRRGLSGSEDGTARLWDISTGKELAVYQSGRDRFEKVALSPDGRLAGATGKLGVIRLWESSNGEELRQLQGHRIPFARTLFFDPDGRRLYSAGGGIDGGFLQWDTGTGQLLRRLQDPKRTMCFCRTALSPDGRLLLSGCANRGFLWLWDMTSSQALKTYTTGEKSISSIAFTPDGRHALTGHPGGVLRLWRLPLTSGQAVADLTTALRLNPESSALHLLRGTCHLHEKRARAALKDLDEAIRLYKGSTEAYFLRGRAYEETQDYDRAIADFTETIRLDPQHAEAYGTRGLLYADKGEYAKAKQDIDKALKLKPDLAKKLLPEK
jgi:WD40 repeat protein/Tfp pilus assembly protein PilF